MNGGRQEMENLAFYHAASRKNKMQEVMKLRKQDVRV
jgi:hypothetical protein